MERTRADVLIVTAVKEEWEAVLAAGGGAKPGSAWEERTGTDGLLIAFRDFTSAGGDLGVMVVQAFGMGREQAVIAAAPLLERHPEIRCLAMCGVCAGRRGDVALGDVIIADRTWPYDAGKLKASVDDQGHRTERFQGDIDLYRIHPPEWKLLAQRFRPDPAARWIEERPRSYQEQGDWVLERLAKNEPPVTHPDRPTKCPDWRAVLEQLWKAKWLDDGDMKLTEAGRQHIRRRMMLEPDGLREPGAFKVVVGPIASGAPVVQDPMIFERLSDTAAMRKVVGLEMETSAILALAYLRKVPHAVVMKGVMDHADADKSDNFKEFAARASAECLLAFVRQHVPPGKGPVLLPGTSPRPRHAGPSALLNARHQVVPFAGRADQVEALEGWCAGEGRVRVRLIHATGGMGKTRLAIELCQDMRAKGWRAGFLSEGDRFGELLESERPVLAVIDYAESQPGLQGWLERAAGWHRAKVLRLLLLARNADEWWTELGRAGASVADLVREETPVELLPVTVSREVMFREAVRAFAKIQNKKAPEGAVPSLADPRYERVLYVHAAALATVEGRPVTADKVIEDTLDHEERFWRKQLQDRKQAAERTALHKMRRAVAALTLTGGVGSAAETEALTGDEEMALLLHDLYPGRPPKYVGGLEPDLLGEAMVWRALSREAEGAGPYLDRVFEGADAQAIRTGFAVLGRLSEDHKEAEGWIERVLGRDVAGRAMEAFAAAKTVGERTAHAVLGMVLARALEREGTVELAKRLEPGLPDAQQTVSLCEVGRWVLEKRLADLPEGSELEERARLLNNLSTWQSALGQREAALASTQEAAGIYRKLAESRREPFLPYLAASLNNLGGWQSELGQREAALASTQEAVDIRRKLAESRPEAFLPDLAQSLNNLGMMQGELGQRKAALASTQEAVDIWRKLAESRPEAFLTYLATSLNNLGNRQSELGQREVALASTQEAVDLYRKLAESRPEAFLTYLAGSLNNLGTMQSELGQREAALASTQEAVDIYRKLAESRPEAFLPDLATSLNNLGVSQSALGQHEAALVSAEAALEAIWPFFLALPAAFERDTGGTLDNLRKRLAALGRAPSPDLLARATLFDAKRRA